MNEVWKSIPEYPSYEASNWGRIRSIDRTSTLVNQGGECKRRINGRVLKPSAHPRTTYFPIALCEKGKTTTRLVHRLVASAWLEKSIGKSDVNHIDGDKQNNRIENLEWVDKSDNRRHAFRIGLQTACGENNSQSKLTKEDVLLIRNSTKGTVAVAKEFRVSPATICDIRKGRSWTHIL
jgi:hypothetical protein